MESPISPYNLAVHITTMDEAIEVVEWFEGFGFCRQGLVPDNYLDYPFIHYNDEMELLTGDITDKYLVDYDIMEYEDWLFALNASDSEPINDDDFLRLLNLM